MTQPFHLRSFHHVDDRDDTPTPVERTYLEVISYLAARGEPVIAARLARWLGVRPPTVTIVLQRLLAKNYIVRGDDGAIALTRPGMTLADSIVRRHRLLERFLYDILGISWHQIHQEAVRLEPAMSPVLLAHIETLVGTATHCPHGNPIPGSGAAIVVGEMRLDAAPIGSRFTITRIDEEVGEDSCMLQRFWISGVLPETTGIRLPNSQESVALKLAQRRVVLSRRAAALVWGTITSA